MLFDSRVMGVVRIIDTPTTSVERFTFQQSLGIGAGCWVYVKQALPLHFFNIDATGGFIPNISGKTCVLEGVERGGKCLLQTYECLE